MSTLLVAQFGERRPILQVDGYRAASLVVALSLFAWAGTARAQLVGEVRSLSMNGQIDAARGAVEQARAASGVSPALLEAMSWIGRGELARHDYDHALLDADATYAEVDKLLQTRKLDADKHLPIALGAAIEVHAQALAGRGERDQALDYLRQQLQRHAGSSIVARVQKNLHLLSLEGKAAPPLSVDAFLGPRPPSLSALRGKPVLVFFWAHWCGDCKMTAPTIARLQSEMGPRGLVVLAPTQTYGFVAGGQEAPPDRERAYIEEVRRSSYPSISQIPAPYGEANFRAWGASTVPTLVLIDRAGIVRLYHPGSMSYEELAPKVEALLAGGRP